MDGVSIAASIIGIATAGAQVSFKLATLATRISTASDRVSAIGNDISLTSSVLVQLGDLMHQKTANAGISILSPEAIETTKTAAAMCEKIFSKMEKEVQRASEQLRRYKPGLGKMHAQKIELSIIERAKWPFLQPRIDDLRTDLRDAKSTLMLLLEVANLALNKRKADASSSEYQDLIRSVVALELDRREERANVTAQQEVSRSLSSNDAPDVGSSNRIPPRETLLKLYQNPTFESRTEIGPKYDPETTISPKDFSGKRKRDSLDANASPGAGRTKGRKPAGIMEIPLETFPGRNPAADATTDPPHSSLVSRTPDSLELQLFLLKPLVKDHYDRIELRWTVQDTNMQTPAICEYMDKNKKDDLPPLFEMLQQLNAYEQEMVDSQVPKDSGRWILSLKRTTIDIRSRDMLFKAVPGLQFVVQCPARRSADQYADRIAHGPPIALQAPPFLAGGFSSMSPHTSDYGEVEDEKDRAQAGTDASYVNVFEPQSQSFKRRAPRTRPLQISYHISPMSGSFDSPVGPPEAAETDDYEKDENEDDKAEAEAEAGTDASYVNDIEPLPKSRKRSARSVPDEEAEAEAMVNDLLKQYTTLFDS